MRAAALIDRKLKGLKVGSLDWFRRQRGLIESKPPVKETYLEWYGRLNADAATVAADGRLLELGSGASFLKELNPEVITSDIDEGIAERVIDARQLPFDDSSLRAIFITHVFHHIPQVERFLAEAERTLVPGGVISMIEVSHTPFGRFFFSNFHAEPYVDDARDWDFAQSHAMMDSNQALSWIVFSRDRLEFERRFPTLEVESVHLLPWLGYLLSGGAVGKNLTPSFMVPIVRFMEKVLSPLRPVFALHWHITVRKKGVVR
jgi:SAM-dependent methyltransferase